MNLDSKEIARYLGSRGADLWPEAAALAADCQRELEGTVTPRTLGRRLSLSLFAGQSRDLDHHLRHCTEGILFAVTLGAETDRLLRRWSAQSMAKAAVGQAVCAVWLDQLCADYCDSFLPTLDEGQYLTPASPRLRGLGPGGPAAGAGPAPGPQAHRPDPHGGGGCWCRRNPSRPWSASATGRRSPAGRSVCDARRKTAPSAALKFRNLQCLLSSAPQADAAIGAARPQSLSAAALSFIQIFSCGSPIRATILYHIELLFVKQL